MAARKDPWLSDLAKHGATPQLLARTNDAAGRKLEARFEALAALPENEAVAQVAVDFFTTFPIRFREQLGVAALAAGVAFLHRAPAEAFRNLPTPAAPNDFVPAWHARVTGALTAALSRPSRGAEELPEVLHNFGEGPATQVAVRAIELLKFAPDVRIAEAAADWLARPPVRASAQTPAFTVLALALAVHGDRSFTLHAEALSDAVYELSWLTRALPQREARPAKKQQTTPTLDSSDDFLRFIAEAPDDDGRVAVFMDWLLQQGDPLGTFMALQRADRPLTDKEQRQLAALLKKNGKTWLRSLSKSTEPVFERGVLRAIKTSAWAGNEVPRLDEPLLSLLHTWDLGGGTNLPLGPLLREAKLTSLRRLITDPRWLGFASDALLAQLEELSLRRGTDDFRELKRPLPKLKRLCLAGNWNTGMNELAALPLLAQLDVLRVESSWPALWEPLRARVKTLELVAPVT